jgi:hypothetical protein
MSDEDLRREEREYLASGIPGRRRAVELSRLASALAAALPTTDELEAWSPIFPGASEFTPDLVARIRAAFDAHELRIGRIDGRVVVLKGGGLGADEWLGFVGLESGRSYGTPRWFEALQNILRTRLFRASWELAPVLDASFDYLANDGPLSIGSRGSRPNETEDQRRARERTHANVRRRPPRRIA